MRQQVLKWQKNAQRISSLPRERPHPELRNEPPLDSLEKPVPNPLVASLWIGSGAGWPLKGLGVASPDHQVGALFEALDEGVLMAPSKSIGYFLPFQVALKYGELAPEAGHERVWVLLLQTIKWGLISKL